MGKITAKKEVATGKLIPYARNAKQHSPEQVQKIADSIREFGFLNPVLVDQDNNIIAGHGRVLAAQQLGLEKVPCVYIEGLTDEQRRAYILADNRLSELGTWDMDLVNDELQDLVGEGFDVGLTGFDWDAAAELTPIEEPFQSAEEVLAPIEEKPEEARTKRGDVWILGDHRLMCGDSSDEADMAKLFADREADMVFTDPPYGVAIGSKNAELVAVTGNRGGVQEDIIGDTLSAEKLYPILRDAMSLLRQHCTEACSYYVSSPQGGDMGLMMMMMMRDAGLQVRHSLIWVKSAASFSLGRLDYDYRHEVIFYTWTKKHNFRGGFDNTVIDDNQRLEELSKAELKDLVHALRGDGSTSVIYCDKPLSSKLHPTMKPLKLIQRFVYNNSEEGDTVADIFGGSGSTLIVCEGMNRKCIMMELDPHYCDVIVERWELFTGRKAVKEVNG